MSSNNNFFERKQIWSEVKDDLLSCYLRPYIQKILMTKKPVYYVDCFAGKGRFNDGSNGSPLIALNIIDDCLQNTNSYFPQLNCCFIESTYSNELTINLKNCKNNINIVNGKYETNIKQLLDGHKGQNIFLYIDPYGIKALKFNLFDFFADGDFYSIEMLINLNSFGFMREACRSMRASLSKINEFDTIIGEDLIEFEPSHMDSSDQSIKDLTDIAGGTYWEMIVRDFIANKINCYEAELSFSKQYCNCLNKKYKYVLNMPIRLKEGHNPKYRMLHVTNHEEGCVLMFENMCKRWKQLGDIQTQGQQALYEVTPENEIIDRDKAREKLLKHFLTFKNITRLKVALSTFLNQYGIIFTPKIFQELLKELDESKSIVIERDPQKKKNGDPSKFYTENSSQKIWIRSNR